MKCFIVFGINRKILDCFATEKPARDLVDKLNQIKSKYDRAIFAAEASARRRQDTSKEALTHEEYLKKLYSKSYFGSGTTSVNPSITWTPTTTTSNSIYNAISKNGAYFNVPDKVYQDEYDLVFKSMFTLNEVEKEIFAAYGAQIAVLEEVKVKSNFE